MKRALRQVAAAISVCAGLAYSYSPTALAANAPTKDLVTVQIGGPSAGYWNTYLAKDLGIFEKHGIKPEFHWFTSGASLLAALKSGSIDQVVTGLATVFAIGQGIPLKIVSWELDNSQGEGLIAKAGTGINSYKDIAKAKKIAAMPGTCSQISLRLMAKKAGVDYKSLNIVNLAPPLFANAFAGGSIDAAVGWAPHSMVQPEGVKVVSWDSEYGGVCPSVNAFRPAFIEKHPDIANRLLAVQAETMQLVKERPDLAIKSLEKYLKLSPTIAKQFYEKHCCDNMPTFAQQLDPSSPFSLVNSEGGLPKQLSVASQMLFESGTIPAPLTTEQIMDAIDASYLKAVTAK